MRVIKVTDIGCELSFYEGLKIGLAKFVTIDEDGKSKDVDYMQCLECIDLLNRILELEIDIEVSQTQK
jgi:hypothetical protein